LGKSALYATCQELTSGSSNVLPVSLMLLPDAPAPGAAGDEDVDAGGVDELELQAASKASGTTAAAVAAKRILFPTGEISFAPRTGLVRCSSGTLLRAIGIRAGARILWPSRAEAPAATRGRVSG
jgi:hypothetical protein